MRFFSKIGIEWGTYFLKKVLNFEKVWPAQATPRALTVKGVYEVQVCVNKYFSYFLLCMVSFFKNFHSGIFVLWKYVYRHSLRKLIGAKRGLHFPVRFKHLECPPLEFQDAKNERNTNGTWVQMGKNGLNRWSKLKHSYDVRIHQKILPFHENFYIWSIVFPNITYKKFGITECVTDI